MPRRRYKPEEVVAKLRQVDVLVSQGQGVADAIRQIGVSENWRRHYNAIRPHASLGYKPPAIANRRTFIGGCWMSKAKTARVGDNGWSKFLPDKPMERPAR